MSELHYVFPPPSPVCQGFPNINVYEIEVVLDADNRSSKYIVVPADVQEIVVTLDPGEQSSGNVYTTTDLYKKVIEDNPGLTWVEWPASWESQVYQDSCPKVTAVKFEQSGINPVKFTMRMQ